MFLVIKKKNCNNIQFYIFKKEMFSWNISQIYLRWSTKVNNILI